ncbi:MAG: dockerin type I domain-containing protein [Planctomycetota bacterium]
MERRRSSSKKRTSRNAKERSRALVISAESRRIRRRKLVVEPLGQRRVLAVITGHVFDDADGSLRAEAGEVQLSSRLAYIDANDNASLDPGEPIAVADQSGQFRFEDVEEGIHSVRLYSGASGQRQTFPAEPVQSFFSQSPRDAQAIGFVGDSLYVLTPDALTEASPIESSTQGLALPFQAASFAPVHGAAPTALIHAESGGAWLVQPGHGTLTQVGAQNEIDVQSAAVGNDGEGVALVEEGGALRVFSLNGLESGSANLSTTSAMVPAGARMIGAESSSPTSIGSRTIFAWSEPTATTRLSIWSNSSARWVQNSSASLTGVNELLSFDDGAGLLAIRYEDGSVGVLDVDAGFAPLHQFDVDGPTKLLPGLDALASINSTPAGFEFAIDDLRNGGRLASRELDAGQIGAPKTLVGDTFDSLFVLGDRAIAALELDQPAARVVEVDGETTAVDIAFGAQLTGSNTPPVPVTVLPVQGTEDEVLEITAATLAQFVRDAEGDRLIPIVVDAPSHGDVQLDAFGGIRYTPEANYFGEDLFAIVFYDGVNVSSRMHFDISLSSSPDSPEGFEVDGLQLPELSEPGYVIGSISVQDVDEGDQYMFDVSDSRFEVVDSKLTYRGGSINFEGEPRIDITVTGYDQAAGHQFHEDLVIAVTDENDPIAFFVTDRGEVYENSPGELIAELSVIDEDLPGQTITYSTDDQRFEIVGNQLRLKPTEALNYEVEPIVTMKVTANDGAGSSLSVDFQVSVLDITDEGGDIGLSNQTVMEWEPGANVGQISVDPGSSDGYQLSVDDSRFEIDGTTLKLVDDSWVRYDDAAQIQLTVTASSAESGVFSKSFVVEVLENATPFHNDDQPYDVDVNGSVTPGDALTVINYLNTYGPGPIGPGDPGYGYDVNGDGMISTIDALLIINYLNRVSSDGTVDGEENPSDSAETDPEVSSTDDEGNTLGTSTGGEGEHIQSVAGGAGGWMFDQEDEDEESGDPWDLYGDSSTGL